MQESKPDIGSLKSQCCEGTYDYKEPSLLEQLRKQSEQSIEHVHSLSKAIQYLTRYPDLEKALKDNGLRLFLM